MNKRPQTISKSFWIKLGLAPFLMFAFAFALVPLYDTFCDLTGLNGRTSNTKFIGENTAKVDLNHKISVEFMSSTTPGLPLEFHPKVKKMEVIPGKLYTITYIAENRSDKTIIGQAIPSFAPGLAAKHFKKLECFCFRQQTFEPKKPREMPVRFFVDSKLDKNIVDVTLSYNFFKVKDNKPGSIAGL